MHAARRVEQDRVRVAVDVQIAPAEAAQAGHRRERPHRLERTVGVVAQHPRRLVHGSVDDVEVAVHLDVRRPGAVAHEASHVDAVHRHRGHLLEPAVLALRQEAEPAGADQGEVHAVVAVPVQRQQRLGGRRRPGRVARKDELHARVGLVRGRDPPHRLAVGGDDHGRRILAGVHHGERGGGTPLLRRLDRLPHVGERLVRRGRGRGRRRHPQESHQRRRDLLRAHADHRQVLAERGRADQHVAEQLRQGRRSSEVAGGSSFREAVQLGHGQLRPCRAHAGQPADRVAQDIAVPRAGGPARPLQQRRQVVRPAFQHLLQPLPRFRQIGVDSTPLQLLRQGETSPLVPGVERRRAPVPGNRLRGPPAETGELALQKGHPGAVGREGVGGLQGGGRALVVSHAHLGDGQIGVNGRLPRRQIARPRELIAGVAEQADLQRRQAPVEDPDCLPIRRRPRRGQPDRRAREPVRRTGGYDGQAEQRRRQPAPAGGGGACGDTR